MLQLKWLEPHHQHVFGMFLVVCLLAATASSLGFAGYQRCARKEVGTFCRKWYALAISWLCYVGGSIGLGACHYAVLTRDGKAYAMRKRMNQCHMLQVGIFFRFFDRQLVFFDVFRVFSLQLSFFQCLQILGLRQNFNLLKKMNGIASHFRIFNIK